MTKQLVTQGLKLLNVSIQSSKQMIAAAADGAYTTARTVHGNPHHASASILEFDFQVQRLNDTAALLATQHHHPPPTLTREEVANTIASAFQHFDTAFPNVPGDRRVTLLLPNLELTQPKPTTPATNLYCHVELLPPIAAPPIVVEIAGQPRDNPLAKDSEWINQRKELEKNVQHENIHEVILSSSSLDNDDQPIAQAVEGTQTNVFVVTKDGTVQTAGEGVLEGSIRKIIMEQCHALDIPLDTSSPPEISQLHEWNEMFLSSTSRLLLPVDQVIVPGHSEAYAAAARALHVGVAGAVVGGGGGEGGEEDGEEDGDTTIVRTFDATRRPIIDRLLRGVNQALAQDSVDVVELSKHSLRARVRNTLKHIQNIDVQSKEIASHVIDLPVFQRANGVGIFLSMDNEVDTGYLLGDLFHSDTYDVGVGGLYPEQRRKVYVPRVTNYEGKGTMDMLRVGGGWSEICSYERNRWNIPEPSAEDAKRMENALDGSRRTDGESGHERWLDMDVVVVPCVAFDSHGRRCGHGGGFYDRFIEELQQKREEAGQEKATLIGVALEEQLVETVVVGKYDTVMDYVVVPTGAIEM
jgi:5-formyltetrahydrofolate cyclo-ligase